MQFALHTLTISIFEFCIRNNIELSVQWIPRSLNQKTASVSKFMDIDDWQITSEFFSLLDQYWGLHTIDCFANFYNTKLKDFSRGLGIPRLQVLMHSFSRGRTRIVCLFPPLLSFVKPLSHGQRFRYWNFSHL